MGSKPFKTEIPANVIAQSSFNAPHNYSVRIQNLIKNASALEHTQTWLDKFNDSDMLRVTYMSKPTRFDDFNLTPIRSLSSVEIKNLFKLCQEKNRADEITGYLYLSKEVYLQTIEGQALVLRLLLKVFLSYVNVEAPGT
jgi:hypothetical protein